VGSVGRPVRQESTVAAIAPRLDASPDVHGALLVGSLASGNADAASDVDLLVRTRAEAFSAAWHARSDLHATGALISWDEESHLEREIATHRWVTDDLLLIEALFATQPGASGDLAFDDFKRVLRQHAVDTT